MGGVGRIFRRGKFWWVAYYQRGREIRISTKSQSESHARRILAQKIAEASLGLAPLPHQEKVSFEDLWTRLKTDYQVNQRRSIRMLAVRHAHLAPFFSGRRALDITPELVARYVSERKDERASNASINRELAMLRRAFRLAVERGDLVQALRIRLLHEDNARQGFLDHADFLRLREALPPYLRDPIAFLYFSGWRVNEMRTLCWRDVDLAGKIIRLRREHSKTSNSRVLPLAGELLAIIERAARLRRPRCQFVFQRDYRPIGDFHKSWHKATNEIGLDNLIVHDLRRTAVRDMVRAGVPERVVMDVTGHRTREIFDRYNIVSETDIRSAVERAQAYFQQQQQGRSNRAGRRS